MGIEVRNITKTFKGVPALKDVSLHVAAGELVALLGPSGSGKTTILRIIAGLEVPDPGSGTIYFHSEEVAGKSIGQRKVGFVFQHYALFRHMSVFENIAFGLRVQPRRDRLGKDQIARKVNDLLKLVQLENMADRRPWQLSGGQRQRVALARALAIEPKVLLLDEPFGALDAKVRHELRRWLRNLHDRIQLTSVFVTHDQEEALEVADRVVVMNEGRIEQVGTPEEVFHHPRTEFVVSFLGNVNLFHGRAMDGKLFLGDTEIDHVEGPAADTASMRLFVRPEDFELSVEANRKPCFQATVCRVHSAGPRVKLEMLSEFDNRFNVEISHDQCRAMHLTKGSRVFVHPRELKIFGERGPS